MKKKNYLRRIRVFFKDPITRIVKDDFTGAACEMAFICILAFFPFLIFLVSVFGLLGTESRIDKILAFLSEIGPVTAVSTVDHVLTGVAQTASKSLATIGFVTSLFLASNASAVAIKGLNKAYHIKETRPFWYVRLLAILIVILDAWILFFGVNLTIFAKLIFNFIPELWVIESAVAQAVNTIFTLRWLVAFAALFMMVFLNYYLMPNTEKISKRIKVIYTLPGAIFFCAFWLLASWGFAQYVENFGSYDKVYGILGGFAVLLIWLYYSSLILLIGGELNYQVYQKFLQKYNKD